MEIFAEKAQHLIMSDVKYRSALYFCQNVALNTMVYGPELKEPSVA
jgi:hypothetical protein